MGANSLKQLAGLLLATWLLSGCAGGPIARQLAQSLAMQVADNAVERALQQSAPVPQQKKTNQLLVGQGIDPYQAAFLRAQLKTPASPVVQNDLPPPQSEEHRPAPAAEPEITQLATLEVWGLVIGPEKHSMFETIRDLGIVALPPESQWDTWQLAEGGQPGAERPMLILVPPEIGKIKSGDLAVVEIGTTDGFYVAKDKLTP